MESSRYLGRTACAVLSCMAMLQPAAAAVQTIFVDTLAVSTVAPTLQGGDTLFVDTLVRNQTGALSQSVTFNVGAGVTGLSGVAAWAINTAAGTRPRLIGVNFDIFDSAHQLVVSDIFTGVQGGFASSTFAAGALTAGTYTLVATGTAVRDTLFDLSLSFEGIASGAPSARTGSLPVQGPSTSEKTAFFQQLQDTRTITSLFTAGDSLLIDSLVTADTGALSQTTVFTVGQGVTGVEADIVWMVTPSSGAGPRLVGVNIDVFDDNDVLVLSDTFSGLASELAHSTIAGALGPGSYKLRITGTGVRTSSIDVSLGFTGTAQPPTGQVPEPVSAVLVLAALGGLAATQRRRERLVLAAA